MNASESRAGIPVVGHRGCTRRSPENTLAAFRTAVALGVDAIEFDVRRAGDGTLVVIHDATVDRTTTGEGAVDGMSVEELKRLEIERGCEIPTLTEVLTFLSETPVDPWIEVKEPGIASGVASALERSAVAGRPVLFASHGFHDELLEVAGTASIRSGISVGPALSGRYPYETRDPVRLADQQGIDAILVTPGNLTEELVSRSLHRSRELGLVIDI